MTADRHADAKWDFTDRTIAITGATGGIARAILAAAAPSKGVRLLLHARDESAANTLATELRNKGANTEVVVGDLATEASTVAETFAALNHIDALINNAGVYAAGGIFDTPLDTMRRAFEINALAAVAMMQAIIPAMTRRGYGRVVNISSGGGSFGEGLAPGHAAYAFSKAAMNAATFLAAKSPRGDVKVNAMCPGWVRTKMGGSNAGRSPEEGADTALWLATLSADGPNGGFFRDRKPIPW